MSGDTFKRAQAGQPVENSARVYNAMLDAILAQKNKQHDQIQAPKDQFRQADIVMVRNDTGYDLSRFSVLGIDGVIFTPDDSLRSFQTSIAFVGGTPDEDVHRGRFVVLLDPLKDGKIGRAWVAGVCVAQVEIVNTDHQFCDVADADYTRLRSSWTGSARILYPASGGSGGSGDEWCIVRLGDSADQNGVARFAGTWTKGTTATVEEVKWDGAAWTATDPAVEHVVHNLASDVETPNEWSYGLLGWSLRNGAKVLDWFECDVAEGS